MNFTLFLSISTLSGFGETDHTYSVPFRDFSNNYPEKVVNTIAATNSEESIMLVYHGNDPAMIHVVRSGASQAKDEMDLPVVGVLGSPGDGKSFSIKINGATPSSHIVLDEEDLVTQVRNEIQRAWREMQNAGLVGN